METISIIIPCYNEEEAIPVYYETMVRQMNERKYRLFFFRIFPDGFFDILCLNIRICPHHTLLYPDSYGIANVFRYFLHIFIELHDPSKFDLQL